MFSDEFRKGVRGGFPVMVTIVPFAALFGALAMDHGFSVLDATFMSAVVFAGASQLVGLDLFGHDVPAWLIVLSVFAVNFRHVLYSASIARHIRHFTFVQKAFGLFLLTDPQFAESEKRGESGEGVHFSWYIGFALVIYLPWIATTTLGALFGRMIGDPRSIGLDVMLPIYFMGMVLGFRKRDNWLPVVAVSAVVSVVAFHVVGSPWHVSIGALAGIALAACLPLPDTADAGADIGKAEAP